MCGDDGRSLTLALLDLVLLRLIFRIVCQVHTFDIDILVCGVVELHPVLALEVVVDIETVVGAYLVDAYGRDTLLGYLAVAQFGKGCRELDSATAGQAHLGIRTDDIVALFPSGKAVTGRGFRLQGNRGEEMAIEVSVGHFETIDVEVGSVGIGI